MFTGLIEEVGKIASVRSMSGGKRIKISAQQITDDIKVDDSIAVDGVCLTATELTSDGFWVDAVGETLTKSTISILQEGSVVNLERALKLADRLGGHIVQGHVNGLGTFTNITKRGENYLVEVNIPEDLCKYVIAEGSIAIDGISLTVAQLNNNKVGLSIIPHTWKNTSLKDKTVGSKVNIEVDVIAKYVEKLLSRNVSSEGSKFTDEWFNKLGY